MTEAYLAPLTDRAVLAVTGPDSVKFLNGIATNEVAHLREGEAAHAGLLSPQGKILFDFLAVRFVDGFLLDAPADKAADLVKRLSMYKLRAAVTLSNMQHAFSTYALWGGALPSPGDGERRIVFADPRHPALGHRLLAQTVIAAEALAAIPHRPASAQDYHAHRIALGVPEGAKDYELGDAYPHEADFDVFNGVSFKKGCYVGQEVVSRMQHKTVVRKRVVRVTGDADLVPGSDVTHNGLVFGRVGSVAGRNGLALLKLDRYVDATAAHEPVFAAKTRITVDADDLQRYLASVQARDKA